MLSPRTIIVRTGLRAAQAVRTVKKEGKMKRRMFVGRVCAAVCCMVAASGSAATITVAAGETLKLDAETNLADNEIRLADGATLAVPADDSNNNYYVHPKIRVQGAARFTADPHPADPDAYTVRFDGGLLATDDTCSLTVSNSIRRIYFGASGDKYAIDGTEISYPIISIKNLIFEDEHEDGGFIFRNKGACTVLQLPTTCRLGFYEANGTYTLAIKGADALAPLGLSNPYRIEDFDVLVLDREAFPPGSAVQVADGRTLGIKPCTVSTTSWAWTGTGQAISLDVTLEGIDSTLLFRNIPSTFTCLDGDVTGRGSVYARGEAANSTCRLVLTGNIACDGGLKTTDRAIVHAGPDTWRMKVKTWFDASDTNSLVKLTAEPPAGRTNLVGDDERGYFETVVGWRDKVKGTNDIVCYNTRIWKGNKPAKNDYVLEVLPYIVPNGLNGLPYLSFGKRGGTVVNAGWGKNANSIDARRLPFWKGELDGANKAGGEYATYAYKYAIMVYGSQEGGGGAILGANSSKIARDTTISDPWIGPSNANSYTMHVDGTEVDPGVATPNGGWQIVSIDLSDGNPTVNSIGAKYCSDSESSNTAGGQNYAEVILFDSVPAASERAACERYLAAKWGLEASYTGPAASGAVRLNSADADASLTVHGPVELAGDWAGALILADDAVVSLVHNPPPSEADIPAAGRVGWWDPDFDATRRMHVDANRPLELDAVLCRTVDGTDDATPWFGGSRSTDGQNNRCPWINGGARGNGPSRRWIDFTDKYDRAMTNVIPFAGNTLRLRAAPYVATRVNATTGAAAAVPVNIRQAFLVLDTSKGGGTPLLDTVGANGVVRARYGTKFPGDTWSRPIHASGGRTTGGVFTEGRAWLDKAEVDPYVHGFTGRPEVLTLETTGDFPAAFLGYYGANDSNAGIDNYEIIGEVLFYSAPLSDADRALVQDYLMHKWSGRIVNPAYSDMSRARLTGAGTLVAGLDGALPDISGFTGTLAVTNASLSFTVGSPMELSCAVSLPEGASITVNVPEQVDNGIYPLLSAASVQGGEDAPLTLAGARAGKYRAALVRAPEGLSVSLSASSMMIIFR